MSHLGHHRRPKIIEALSSRETILSSLDSSSSGGKETLKNLLSLINQHVREITGRPILFNGVRLVYSADRTSRVPLRCTDKNVPLVLLYIGKPRDLSITPLRFNTAEESSEVCDVTLGSYSLITIPPESVQHLHTYLSPDTLKSNSEGDEQVLLIPFCENVAEGAGETRTE